MSLAEVLLASLVLAAASTGSLQIWAASAAAAQATQQRTAQLLLVDRLMLEAEAQQRLAIPAAGLSCERAVTWIAAQLQSQPLPAGVSRDLQLQFRGLWLQFQVGALPARRRWLDVAATASCGSAPEAAAESAPASGSEAPSPNPDGPATSTQV